MRVLIWVALLSNTEQGLAGGRTRGRRAFQFGTMGMASAARHERNPGRMMFGKNESGVPSITTSKSFDPAQPRRLVALVTGITGQDGSYLAELLLSKGYEVRHFAHHLATSSCHRAGSTIIADAVHSCAQVHGMVRRASSFNRHRIEGLPKERLHLHYGDLSDSNSCQQIMEKVKPSEVYNLAAQSHVMTSFETSEYTAEVDALGVLRLLNAIRVSGLEKEVRFYQASTSELFGRVREVPQSEKTFFYPRSPYGVAKQYAYWMVVNYREAYGMHASNGILFNHESPRRGPTFVTRKVTRTVARIHLGLEKQLFLGNLDATRDWGHARDYVMAMWLMLQQPTPDDFVIATGKKLSVRAFVEAAFRVINIKIVWQGSGVNEIGYGHNQTNPSAVPRPLVRVDPKFYRPTEVAQLLGDPTKAKELLGWEATTTVDQLCQEMVTNDLKLVAAGDLES